MTFVIEFLKSLSWPLPAIVIAASTLNYAPAECAADDVGFDKAATDQAIDAWRDKRFGMFIHWGPVALAGTKMGWSRGKEIPIDEYDQLYKRFNPTAFDAEQWVRVAKDAGMKYLVITSKHHDGFCLWPSKYTDYHIGNTPFKRDVLKEVRAACDKNGIQFGTYYSILDWRDPDYPLGSPGGSTKKDHPDMQRFFELIRNQTKELITNYGPLGVMWFDGDWEEPWNHELGSQLYVELKEQQPSLLINNRVGKSRPGVAAEGVKRAPNSGDFDTPEQRIGSFNREFPWETCMTLATSDTWSWDPNDGIKSFKECLQALLQCAGGDGNLLLNVGPMPNGQIEPRQVARLAELGAWLKKYGDGVYGTRGGPFKPGAWGTATCKDNRIFLYIMRWPADGPLKLPAVDARVVDTKTLSGGHAVVKQDSSGISIDFPNDYRDEVATVVELTMDRSAFGIMPVDVTYQSGSLARGKQTSASNTFFNEDAYSANRATDDDYATRWATDSGQQPAWVEVDLDEPRSIDRVFIDEPAEYQRIQAFELQYFDGTRWKSFYTGTTVGPEWSTVIKPVIVSRRVRLNILKSTDSPTIREFQLYGQSSPKSATSSN
jgi:alpha-L-fucosidase